MSTKNLVKLPSDTATKKVKVGLDSGSLTQTPPRESLKNHSSAGLSRRATDQSFSRFQQIYWRKRTKSHYYILMGQVVAGQLMTP